MTLPSLRKIVKRLWFEFLFRSGATTWARKSLLRRGEAIVLTLHRVLSEQELLESNSPHGMILSERVFHSLLDFLTRCATFVPVTHLPEKTSHLAVALTFDDGWADNYRLCSEHLHARKIAASIFVCPGLVGKIEPFWPEKALAVLQVATRKPQNLRTFRAILTKDFFHLSPLTESTWIEALKQLGSSERNHLLERLLQTFSPPKTDVDRTMTWGQLRDLASLGFEIGAHTTHHEMLPRLSAREQSRELTTAQTAIRSELGSDAFSFSYPNGSWNEESRNSVVAANYKTAFINAPGVWSSRTDPYRIPRINLSDGRLTGWDGQFSKASAHYFLFWLPYLHRKQYQLARRDSSDPAVKSSAQKFFK